MRTRCVSRGVGLFLVMVMPACLVPSAELEPAEAGVDDGGFRSDVAMEASGDGPGLGGDASADRAVTPEDGASQGRDAREDSADGGGGGGGGGSGDERDGGDAQGNADSPPDVAIPDGAPDVVRPDAPSDVLPDVLPDILCVSSLDGGLSPGSGSAVFSDGFAGFDSTVWTLLKAQASTSGGLLGLTSTAEEGFVGVVSHEVTQSPPWSYRAVFGRGDTNANAESAMVAIVNDRTFPALAFVTGSFGVEGNWFLSRFVASSNKWEYVAPSSHGRSALVKTGQCEFNDVTLAVDKDRRVSVILNDDTVLYQSSDYVGTSTDLTMGEVRLDTGETQTVADAVLVTDVGSCTSGLPPVTAGPGVVYFDNFDRVNTAEWSVGYATSKSRRGNLELVNTDDENYGYALHRLSRPVAPPWNYRAVFAHGDSQSSKLSAMRFDTNNPAFSAFALDVRVNEQAQINYLARVLVKASDGGAAEWRVMNSGKSALLMTGPCDFNDVTWSMAADGTISVTLGGKGVLFTSSIFSGIPIGISAISVLTDVNPTLVDSVSVSVPSAGDAGVGDGGRFWGALSDGIEGRHDDAYGDSGSEALVPLVPLPPKRFDEPGLMPHL